MVSFKTQKTCDQFVVARIVKTQSIDPDENNYYFHQNWFVG